jgi:hypothetical protein
MLKWALESSMCLALPSLVWATWDHWVPQNRAKDSAWQQLPVTSAPFSLPTKAPNSTSLGRRERPRITVTGDRDYFLKAGDNEYVKPLWNCLCSTVSPTLSSLPLFSVVSHSSFFPFSCYLTSFFFLCLLWGQRRECQGKYIFFIPVVIKRTFVRDNFLSKGIRLRTKFI